MKENWTSWLWLLIGTALLPFTLLQTIFPVAAWLAPVFLLRFSRSQPKGLAVGGMFTAYTLAALAAIRNGFLDPPPPAWLVVGLVASYALIFSLSYVTDRLISPLLKGFPRTLVFPLAAATVDWLLSFHPFPTFASPAYTQYGNLPLIQVVSLTGMWGLTFLIAWFGTAANSAWEAGFNLRAASRTIAPFAIVLGLVLLYGNIRLEFFPPQAEKIQVVGITPDRRLFRYPPVAEIARRPENRRQVLRDEFAPILEDLFARTRQQAQAGAKIVVWSETAAFILAEDEEAVMERARQMARDEEIYLQLGLMVIQRSERYPYSQNRAILLDPDGRLVWDYHKAYPVPIGDAFEIEPGPRIVPVADTPYGRLANVICFDADQSVIVATIPVRGTSTLYARIGDSFAYSAAAALSALILVAVVRRPQVRETVAQPV